MLTWDTDEQQEFARRRFEKWKGFHEDVLGSRGFEKRDPVSLYKSFGDCYVIVLLCYCTGLFFLFDLFLLGLWFVALRQLDRLILWCFL